MTLRDSTSATALHAGARRSKRNALLAALVIASTLSCLATVQLHAQTTASLSGVVRSAQSHDEIAGASIAIIGTTRGARANRDGLYRIQLPLGIPVRLRVTAVGYRPDTIAITLSKDDQRTIELQTAPITSSEITISAKDSRREAERVIGEAMKAKEAWYRKLSTYQFQTYARLTFGTIRSNDTNILSVLESESNGFWSKTKGYAEQITARRQTANMPAQINRAAILSVIDLYDDSLDIEQYSLPGPLSPDALSKYDFDLVGTRVLNGEETYELSMEPASTLIPGFIGHIWIGKADYELAYVDLSLSDAVKLGPLTKSRLEESFQLVDNNFWMPAQLSISAEATLQLPIVPTFHLEHVSVMQNFVMNPALPDSLFGTKRHEVLPHADSVDPIAWAAVRTVPLTPEEEHTYLVTDSAAKRPPEPEVFSPIGTLFSLLINPNLYQYNRVEGSRLQIEGGFDQLGSWPLGLDFEAAYGIGDNRFGYDATLSQGILWKVHHGFSASYNSAGDFSTRAADQIIPILTASLRLHEDRVRHGDARSVFLNTLEALLFKSDYPDYYWARGFDLQLDYNLSPSVGAMLRYRSEYESSMDSVVARFSVFSHGMAFRSNPAINEGRLGALQLAFTAGHDWTRTSIKAGLLAEDASTSLGGNFNFTKAEMVLSFDATAGGWGSTNVTVDAGKVFSGQPGSQHLFIFETPNGLEMPRNYFVTMGEREFQGDAIAQVYVTQDFYDLPTRLLGIHFLDRFQLHYFGFVNLGISSISSSLLSTLAVPVVATGSQPFAEVGVGLGNILNVFRADLGYRLNHHADGVSNFGVRGTLGFTF